MYCPTHPAFLVHWNPDGDFSQITFRYPVVGSNQAVPEDGFSSLTFSELACISQIAATASKAIIIGVRAG